MRRSSVVLLVLLLAGAGGAGAVELEVGVVNLQQAFQRSHLVLVMSASLNRRFVPVRRKLQGQGRKVAELRRALSYGDLGAAERRQLEEELEVKSAELQAAQRAYREELAAAQETEGKRFLAQVVEVASEVAEELELYVLFEDESIVYSSPDFDPGALDITEAVVRALHRKTESPDGVATKGPRP